jgi:hypothetical protein
MSGPAEVRRSSPIELRRELHDLIVADLLGPAGGEHETLTDPRERVSARYLAGMLAPCGTVAVEPGRLDDAGVDGEEGGNESGSGSDLVAQSSLFPSSIGLTFAVLPEVSRVRVTATWGKYLKERQDGREDKVWQRYPMEGTRDIALTDGLLEPVSISDDAPGVRVRGRCTRGARAWLVSLFLVNGQATPKTNKDEAWLFQPALTVTTDGQAVFVGRHEAVLETAAPNDASEEAELDLLFRHEVEFAVGHGVAVHTALSPDIPARATALQTVVAPAYEVARVEAPTVTDVPDLANVVLDMNTLAETPDEALGAVLRPLADAYDRWLDKQEGRLEDPGEALDGMTEVANASIMRARTAAARLRAGIDLVAKGGVVADAFRFSNRSMWLQRIRTVAVNRRRTERGVPFEQLLATSDVPKQRSWRPFQLAFLLVNLPALADPLHPERSPEKGLVDLLFFPTGGGKTEAYLGLTAFTLAIRRLQGKVAGHDGSDGLAVLMRYTLRLLTAQQFQRATALICACEVIRRERLQAGDARWGETPFRVGMWVGSAVTPNYTKVAQKALDHAHGIGGAATSRAANPVQIVNCPWCGHTGLQPRSDPDRWRTLVFCGDEFGACDFSSKKSPGEGIPVVTVDEEIYRLLPALVIATVDKFAQLPWQGPLHTLFGRVERRCPRHGYRSPDLDAVSGRQERDSHTKTAQLPAAKTVACDPLRPPDLIIQDELHLISGPLGTMVGLYESAIDRLSSWDVDGHRVRPKVIASTATIRRAAEQVHALFWRQVEVFPPQVLDAGDSFFARRRPTADVPGRLYLGVCAPGVRLKAVEARVFTTVLTAAQRLYEKYGRAADPWMTMVGYFNALRELGGARRIIEDDVTNRMRRADRKGLARRRRPLLRELTSRVSSGDIPEILDQLGVVHDPDRAKGSVPPIDVLLATNMISVGVDVSRLGLMVAVGQPKATAEYIQATSRVGRDLAGPGLVVTIYNWARPRDLSHYESFEQYHATFYRHVEALSVTPFSARALDRGLTGVLVAMARQLHLPWNPNRAAQVAELDSAAFADILEELSRRAGEIAGYADSGELTRDLLKQRLDEWLMQQQKHGAPLAYRRPSDASAIPLLQAPGAGAWTTWTCPTSMREVEANVNLIMDTLDPSVQHAPAFQPAPKQVAGPSTNEDDLEGEVEEAERA